MNNERRTAPYWEQEEPVEVSTGRNRLSYYGKARVLQVRGADWINEDGELRSGKAVTIHVNKTIKKSPEAALALARLLRRVADDLERGCSEDDGDAVCAE